jgi:hypothetical protein
MSKTAISGPADNLIDQASSSRRLFQAHGTSSSTTAGQVSQDSEPAMDEASRSVSRLLQKLAKKSLRVSLYRRQPVSPCALVDLIHRPPCLNATEYTTWKAPIRSSEATILRVGGRVALCIAVVPYAPICTDLHRSATNFTTSISQLSGMIQGATDCISVVLQIEGHRGLIATSRSL